MSVKQGFAHIIVYDFRSVKKAVADALKDKTVETHDDDPDYEENENNEDKCA